MGILNKDFEQAISSDQASRIRGKMGIDKGNTFIQGINNKFHNRKHCGFDKK